MSSADSAGKPTMRALEAVLDMCIATASRRKAFDDIAEGLSLTELLAAASRTRTTPLLGWWMLKGDIQVPEWLRESCVAAFRHWDAQGKLLASLADDIHQHLSGCGLRVLFRKGVHVSALYPATGCRPFSDIDPLISGQDRHAVEAALADLGLTSIPITRTQHVFLKIATNSTRGFTDSAQRFVDPATSLLVPTLAARWAGGVELTIDRVNSQVARREYGFLGLCAPYLLVDLVLNAYIGATTMRYVNRMRFQRLTPYVDILMVAGGMSQDDWATFDAVVQEFNLGQAVEFVVNSGSAIFGASRFHACWPGQFRGTSEIHDYYGELEFGERQAWLLPIKTRLTLDRLPTEVPPWTSPI